MAKCKYCSPAFYDNKDILYKRMGIGNYGDLVVEIKLGNNNFANGKIQLRTRVSIVSCGCISDQLIEFSRKIKYCPICGRKLEKE